ncbi:MULTISPECIES: hypothetical protein [Rhodococcus]|uniref:hypothetical protein n=1 Tax=Rhodococcus TaxID=1827 RepID=UPI00111FE7D6|nr:hypothetical protein [Rhodococcus ruber]NCL75281.1 hypothetical protein [Rhodococcus sp. YH1]QDC13958.1 hypothetical protein E2561_07685 [Rhodococcus ruber]QRE80498.1 hypothetical protein F1734_09720 [Rhodococcus ruber]
MTGAVDRDEARLRVQIGEASAALMRLQGSSPAAATALVRLVQVIADKAARTPRFAHALASALTAPGEAPSPAPAPRKAPAARRGTRAPGPFDPFAAFRDGGEAGLRAKLAPLDVEQLKDIVAEHAMDYDRLAMRWRTPKKLQDRIVERVKALTTKGDAFR